MRIRMYIAAFYGVAAIAVSGFAEAMTMRTQDAAIGGQLEIACEDGTHSADTLKTQVHVRIRGDVSEVHLHQVFSPAGTSGHATYFLPLAGGTELVAIEISQGAAIHRRGLEGHTPVSADPYVLSQDLNLAGDLPVDITVVYRQAVRIDGEVHSVTLPIANVPRGWNPAETLHAEFEDMPEYLRGETVLTDILDRDRIEITVSIDRSAFREIYSDTHEIDVTAVDGGRIIELAAGEPVANRAFTLAYVPEESGTTQVANIERTR